MIYSYGEKHCRKHYFIIVNLKFICWIGLKIFYNLLYRISVVIRVVNYMAQSTVMIIHVV